MAKIIAETYQIDRLKVIKLRSFGGDGCTYYLVDRCGRLQRTMVKIFINESFDFSIIICEPK